MWTEVRPQSKVIIFPDAKRKLIMYAMKVKILSKIMVCICFALNGGKADNEINEGFSGSKDFVNHLNKSKFHTDSC